MSKKEIDKKFDEIVEFSGVEKFIDTPIKRYSTGMNVRLAFSVAAHIEPEILIIDEVLAVGDVDFQKKCLGKMGDIAKVGRTVLFVSHNMGAVSHLCKKVMLLEDGRVKNIGDSKNVIKEYLSVNKATGEVDLRNWNTSRYGDGPMRLLYVRTLDRTGNVRSDFKYGEPVTFAVGMTGAEGLKLILAIIIKNELGQIVLHFTSQDDDAKLDLNNDVTEIHVKMESNLLNQGTYYISTYLGDHRDYVNDMVSDCLAFSVNTIDQGRLFTISDIRMPVKWEKIKN